MSTQSFASLGVSNAVVEALSKDGITSPFPIQQRVLPDALDGRDLLVRSPTGSGKSLAFGVPMVDLIEATDRRVAALVLVPTRELASQIVDALRGIAHARALSITAVYGGAGIERQSRAAAKAHILVATPGRLEDLLQRRAITLAHIKLLVLDEADRMLDMGFKPAVDRIVAQCSARPPDDVLLGDARRRRREARQGLHARRRAATRRRGRRSSAARSSIASCRRPHRQARRARRELHDAERGRTLVFVRTKRGADRLVKRLRAHDVTADAMHGDKTPGPAREGAAPLHDGETTTLIATDVAARGLDVDGITHVINFDAPGAREDYVHRIGRTGRAGATGVGITFVAADQARDVHKIARDLRLEGEFAQSGLRIRG